MRRSTSYLHPKRLHTRQVMVGNVGVGGDNPIRIQSMTTSSTREIEKTVEQILRLADEGCEIARVTVQGIKEAESCEGIKNALVQKGYTIPLVADIHFYPKAAFVAADFVDKIRINPGNFVDRRATFKKVEYSEALYAEEVAKIEETFGPLVEKCARLKRAMRIGVNHGSLSDRILNRYGDTPFGMVESALEFARVCRAHNYHDFLFSMKASRPRVMIDAYHLLAKKMVELDWNYPLHLGVTESGQGQEGRIKSSVGIGSLLLDGLGDTIRVSLTEDPWDEIDPCKRLKKLATSYREKQKKQEKKGNKARVHATREHQKGLLQQRGVSFDGSLHRDGSVFLSVNSEQVKSLSFYQDIGCRMEFGRPRRTHLTVDGLIFEGEKLPEQLVVLSDLGIGIYPHDSLCIVKNEEGWKKLKKEEQSFILFQPDFPRLDQSRRFFHWLQSHEIDTSVLLYFDYSLGESDLIINAAAECGALLIDRLGEGLALTGRAPLQQLHAISFGILQAVGMRTSKTEFISCPGCGRTLFDLQEVSSRIREKTAHLPGVKIAIMGCIVNGPGEMADADFGYVGSKPGKIDLYVGKKCVERNIDFSRAEQKLIELIKAHGRWVEPAGLVQ